MTKTFTGNTKFAPTVVANIVKGANISAGWAAHQAQILALEASGKRINGEISFQTFSEMSRST
jgi:hypothetical protein